MCTTATTTTIIANMATKRKKSTSIDGASKRSKGSTGDVPEKNKPSTTIFSLPAELRNSIYELVLIHHDPKHRIQVTPNLREPGLLAVNRQVRAEASKIYWLRNKFLVRVKDCDGTIAHAMGKRLVYHHASQQNEVVIPHLDYTFTGKKKWKNVVDWCERLHSEPEETLVPGEQDGGGSGRKEAVIVAALHLVAMHRDIIWEDCLRSLHCLRYAVGRLESEWWAE